MESFSGRGVRKFCLFALALCVSVPHVLATPAKCQPGWGWASNSKQQNPCEVAGALDAGCRGVIMYGLGPMSPHMGHIGPHQNDSSALGCNCNTVMYSLYMACAACQNVTTTKWSSWSKFCPTVDISKYSGIIPPDTAIPYWAFLNYTTEDKFNSLSARAAGDVPEVLASPSTTPPPMSTPSPTSTLEEAHDRDTYTSCTETMSSNPPASTLTSLTSPSTGSSQQNNHNKSSPDVSAIVEGVFGGLIFLAVVGIPGTWMFLRRSRRSGGDACGNQPDDAGHPVDPVVSQPSMRPSWMRLYCPSDPSTFPDQPILPDQNHGTRGISTVPTYTVPFNNRPSASRSTSLAWRYIPAFFYVGHMD